MDLRKMKIGTILPKGINRIEHSIRITLGLNCTEYCVFDTILSRKQRKKPTKFVDIENYTGLLPSEINNSINKMIEATLIKIVNNEYLLNRNMIKAAFAKQEDQFEKEFEQFWKIEKDKKLVNCWPGPRTDALNKFKIARKKHSFEFIMKQRDNYFKLLEHEIWRKPMQATKFLNIKTGQIEEDWVSQWPDHFKQEKETQPKPLTKQQKDNLYN
jgi:hypothetical protein